MVGEQVARPRPCGSASSPGEASPSTRWSTIASRTGSPRAAWIRPAVVVPLSSPPVCLQVIETSMVEVCRTSSPRPPPPSRAVAPAARRDGRHRAAGHRRRRVRDRRAALSPGDVGLQLLENSTATVFGLAVLILIFGPVSGAHFNPVVSAVDWLLGRRPATADLPGGDVAAYTVAQIVGSRPRRRPGEHHVRPGSRQISTHDRATVGPGSARSSPPPV